jgi:hypothetical protein
MAAFSLLSLLFKTSAKALAAWRFVRCDPSRLIFAEQLGSRSAPQPMAVMTSARLAVTWPPELEPFFFGEYRAHIAPTTKRMADNGQRLSRLVSYW